MALPSATRDLRICALIGTGHFLSHFYMLCLPPLFLAWRAEFDVSFATLGAAVALMGATTAALQTPVGFWVDRYGAKPFLVGGTLLMALSISAMAFAQDFRLILLLAVLSGVGNSVIHPADYAIMAGSIRQEFTGRAFALHTFTGNLGFALAPPTIALLLLVMDWRGALLTVGLLGLPVVAAILWQSSVLHDQQRRQPGDTRAGARALLLSKPILAFFGFFLLSAMAGSAISAFLITVLGKLWGAPIAVASLALTGYMTGATFGTLVGGWIADKRNSDLLGFVVGLTLCSIALVLSLGFVPMAMWMMPPVALVAGLCLGASRTPRDVMLKQACPPGEVGKVFGFVSAGLPLGAAVTPIPMGFLIDLGYPMLVLPAAALLLAVSLLFAGTARGLAKREAARGHPVPAE